MINVFGALSALFSLKSTEKRGVKQGILFTVIKFGFISSRFSKRD